MRAARDSQEGRQASSGEKQPYEPPEILSSEPLEAAAATCQPPTPPLGKTVPIPCQTLGS